MKNIQGRDPNLKAKHGLPSGTAGGTARPHRCAPSCAPEFSGRLLSENEGVLPRDLQRLYLNSCNPKYIAVGTTAHLPFG